MFLAQSAQCDSSQHGGTSNAGTFFIYELPEGIEVDCVFVLVGVDFGLNALKSGGEQVQKVIHSIDLMTQQFDCSQTLFHPFDCRPGVCESCLDGTHCLKGLTQLDRRIRRRFRGNSNKCLEVNNEY